MRPFLAMRASHSFANDSQVSAMMHRYDDHVSLQVLRNEGQIKVAVVYS
jgi:hypothetical protein